MGLGQGGDVVASVQGDHRARRVGCPTSQRRLQLVDRQGGRQSDGRPTSAHVQRQDPTPPRFGHRDQPLVGPGRHHTVPRPTGRHAPLVGPLGAGRRRGPRPVRAIQRPQRPLAAGRGQVGVKEPAHGQQVDRPIRQCIAGARPPTPEGRTQAEPYQRTPVRGGEHRVEQFEQAILAVAQAGIELLAEGREPRQCFGVQTHPASMTLAGSHRRRAFFGAILERVALTLSGMALLGVAVATAFLYAVWALWVPLLPNNLYLPLLDLGKITGYTWPAAILYLQLILGLYALYALGYRLVARGAGRLAVVFVFGALFCFELVWAYPATAVDVFGYVAHGRLLAV